MYAIAALSKIVRNDARIEVKVPAAQGRKAYSYFREGAEGEGGSPRRPSRKIAAGVGGAIAAAGLAGLAAIAMGRKKLEGSSSSPIGGENGAASVKPLLPSLAASPDRKPNYKGAVIATGLAASGVAGVAGAKYIVDRKAKLANDQKEFEKSRAEALARSEQEQSEAKAKAVAEREAKLESDLEDFKKKSKERLEKQYKEQKKQKAESKASAPPETESPVPPAKTKVDDKQQGTSPEQSLEQRIQDAGINDAKREAERVLASKSPKIDAISKDLGVTNGQAQKMLRSVERFTELGTTYEDIRDAEKKGKSHFVNDYKETGRVDAVREINDFLDKSKKYEGVAYRGFALKESALDPYLKQIQGDGLVLSAMSSFSKDRGIGYKYSRGDNETGDKKVSILLISNSNKSGVDIEEVSSVPREKEVLVPAGTFYKATKVEVKKGRQGRDVYHIYVDEVDSENQRKRRG